MPILGRSSSWSNALPRLRGRCRGNPRRRGSSPDRRHMTPPSAYDADTSPEDGGGLLMKGAEMAKGINHLATADGLFFGKGALDLRKTGRVVDEALKGCDDGELFLEYVQSESLAFDDGKLNSAAYDTTQGFGLRAVSGEVTGFSHASALDEKALKRAADTVKAVRAGKGGTSDESPRGTNRLLYADDNPIDGEAFEKKVKLLQEIDAYVRGKIGRAHV